MNVLPETSKLSDEHFQMLQHLAPFLEQVGIQLPGVTRFAPKIDITRPAREIALEVGRCVARQPIFLKGTAIVTIDETTGEEKFMSPIRFCTWAEEFCVFSARNRAGIEGVVPFAQEVSAKVLTSDVFHACIRKLTAVHYVRLPVRRSEELVELLEPGYDAASGIYTVDTLAYPTDMPLPEARSFFVETLRQYPWGQNGDAMPAERPDELILANANVSMQMHAIIGTFCRGMFEPGTPRPMMLYLGNQPGTGKSTLAVMALAAVYGDIYTTDKPENAESFQKLLETKAINMAPYLFFDDVGQGIYSQVLNRFITSPGHSSRALGGNTEFKVPNVTQVYATGNTLKSSPDLQRRSLIIDLFLPGEVRGRKFEHVITAHWLSSRETRGKMLAACWAIVREWQANGMCMHPRPLESFELFTSTVGGMVMVAGFADPLQPLELPAGGDERGADLKSLLVAVATAALTDYDFTRQELVVEARRLGLLESYVGCEGDPDLKQADSQKFGNLMKNLRGRTFVDSNGRNFRFGKSRTNRGKTYPLEFI